MIGLQKFRSLPAENQVRKLRLWFREIAQAGIGQASTAQGMSPSAELLAQLLADGLAKNLWQTLLSPELLEALKTIDVRDPHALHRLDLLFCRDLGIEAAEWDLAPFSRPPLGEPPGLIVYLENLRSPFNVGSIFRSAEAFGFSKVLLSPACPQPLLSPRLERSAMGALGRIPWEQVELSEYLERQQDDLRVGVFALELGGSMIENFSFPKAGIVVLGSEELGVHPKTLALCRHSAGIVSIPLWGSKASLNVGVSFGILAAAWANSLQV